MNHEITLSWIEVGLQYISFINVLSECPFLRHRFWLYLQDRCTQMDWKRSCRPGSSNQGHTQRWGTRCHSHCSKIPGYRSNSQPHSELQSYSGRFLGDSLSLQSFLPYSKFLGDRCHLRDQISAVLRWTINQKKQIQMEIFLTNNINMYNASIKLYFTL